MKMVETYHRLLVFNSVHRVMVAEEKLKDRFEILLIPVPLGISADCGMALRVYTADVDEITRKLCTQKLEPFSIYASEVDGYAKVGEFS